MKLLLFIVFFQWNAEAMDLNSNVFKVQSLIRQNQIAKAEELLQNWEQKGFYYYKLKGFIHRKNEEIEKAIVAFDKALEIKKDEDILLSSGQAYLKIKKPHHALKKLKASDKESVQKSLLMSEAYWALDQKNKALEITGQKDSKTDSKSELLERQHYLFLHRLSRLEELFASVERYINIEESSAEPALFAIQLLKEKDLYLSEKLFDLVLEKRPQNAFLLKERGAFELEKKRVHVAHLYFSKAAHLDKTYNFEASVSKLLAGYPHESLFYAQNITDTKKRLKQKFLILMEQERYFEALSLKEHLKRYDLLKEEKLTYALLYSAFKIKDHAVFQEIFTSQTLTKKLSQVMKLKVMLDQCKKEMGPVCVFS